MDYPELVRRIESQDRGTCTNSEPDDRCPVCHGTGLEWVTIVTEAGEEYPNSVRKCTACNGNHEQRVRETKALADIPDDRTMSSFNWNIYTGHDVRREQKTVEAFVEKFEEFEAEPMGLYITSKTRGSGKTFLASCIGGELINRYDVSTVFVNASDLLDISQRKTDDGADPLERLISCRVLILDDLGQKMTGRDWLTDVLFKIIDKRYQARRLLIVTSNYPLKELDFDDRIIDRLYAMSCPVNLPEYRVRSQEANSRRKAFLQRLGIDLPQEAAG